MSDEKLVEAMVKAIHENCGPWWEADEADARAALAALREAGYAVVPSEPTEAMLRAADAEDEFAAARNHGTPARAEVHWYAMIDAALQEVPGE